MVMSVVVTVLELLLMLVLAVAAVKLGRMLVSRMNRVLPVGRNQRIAVLVIGLSVALYFATDTAFSNVQLGIFTFVAGGALLWAYTMD